MKAEEFEKKLLSEPFKFYSDNDRKAIFEFAEAYAEHCENEYRAKLNKVLNNLGEDEFVRLEQENKELRDVIDRVIGLTDKTSEGSGYQFIANFCKQALKK